MGRADKRGTFGANNWCGSYRTTQPLMSVLGTKPMNVRIRPLSETLGRRIIKSNTCDPASDSRRLLKRDLN